MADAFQVAASAFAVAELALKIYEELSTFITRAKNADATANGLRNKIERFRTSVNTVRLTATHRKVVSSSHFEYWEENHIWSIIHDSLKGWDKVLDEFKAAITRLRPERSQHSLLPWIEKALKQLELDRKTPWFERLESAIGSHIEEISLSLNCLQIIILGNNSLRLYRLDQRLARVNGASIGYDSTPSLRASHPHNSPHGERAVPRCVEIARQIQNRSSISSGSANSVQSRRDSLSDGVDDLKTKAHTSSAEGAIDNEFDDLVTLWESRPQSRHQSRIVPSALSSNEDPVEDEDDDCIPDSDDVSPQEVLDALIQRYRIQAKMESDNACFDKAEFNQRRLIARAMECNQAYGCQYNIQVEKFGLVKILEKKDDDGSREEARKLIDLLLRGTPQTTPRLPQSFPTRVRSEEERLEHSRLYLVRAKVEYQQFCQDFTDEKPLDLAEKFAKRSFKLLLELRLVDDIKEDFARSVEHLVRVYEIKRDDVAMQTYRDLYLDSTPDNSRLAPSISITTSQTSASPLPHLDRAPTFPEDLDIQNGVAADGHTHLVSAILEKDSRKVEKILQRGADPNQLSLNKSPLLHAIDSGVEIVVIKLRERGARINAESGAKAPLIYAIEKRAASMVELLCDLGADVEASPRKMTPLLLAARLKLPEVVQTLCQHKAKINAKCPNGLSALHWAISGEHTTESRDVVCEVLQILLEKHADPNAKDNEGKSPLHHAVQEKDNKCLEFLLESPWSFDLEAQDNEDRTPLGTAIRQHYIWGVELCLAKGAIIPDPLPRDTHKYIRQVIQHKRRGSNESSASASGDAMSLRASTTGSNRRLSTATRDSRTLRSRFSFLGNRSR